MTSGSGRGTLGKVRDGLGMVGGPSVKTGTFAGTLGEDRGTLDKVRDGSRDPRGG